MCLSLSLSAAASQRGKCVYKPVCMPDFVSAPPTQFANAIRTSFCRFIWNSFLPSFLPCIHFFLFASSAQNCLKKACGNRGTYVGDYKERLQRNRGNTGLAARARRTTGFRTQEPTKETAPNAITPLPPPHKKRGPPYCPRTPSRS